jgi:hypothetical protein
MDMKNNTVRLYNFTNQLKKREESTAIQFTVNSLQIYSMHNHFTFYIVKNIEYLKICGLNYIYLF